MPLLYWHSHLRGKLRAMLALIANGIAILFCGFCGAFIAWTIVDALGWTGVAGAVLTAFIGMAAATLLWIAGVALRRALGRK